MADTPEPLSESLRPWVDAERACPEPPAEARQRTMSRLSATLGLPSDLGLPPSHPAGADLPPGAANGHPVTGVLARGSYRAVATFLVGAAVGAAVYGTVAGRRRAPPPQMAPARPTQIEDSPPSPVSTVLAPEMPSATEPAPRPAATVATVRGNGEPAVGGARDGGLAAERNLIEMARTALARGRADGALALLRRHVRQFSKGQLGEERDSLLIQALVAKGDHAQARERAARFRRHHPTSLFLPAVEQAVQSIP